MATITCGTGDKLVEKVKHILDRYEQEHPGARATVYRQNSVSIRIRIVDEAFSNMSKGARHDLVWNFISDKLDDEEVQDVSMLLLLSPKEQARSFMSEEFDDPVPSEL